MNTVQDNQSSQSIGQLGRALPGQVVLVLQGGGALGSYQAGVYQALGVFATCFPASTKNCPTGRR
jgi:NTE family protein